MAEYTGTYTAGDYLDILEHLMKKWKVSSRTGACLSVSPCCRSSHLASSLCLPA